jgi:acetyltransferase EpsM
MKIIIVGGQAGAKIATEIFTINYPHSEILYAETYWVEKKEVQITDDYRKVPKLISEGGFEYFIATGDNLQRSEIHGFIKSQTQKEPINCIHPSVVVSPSAKIGFGNLICPTAVLHTDSEIGNCTIVNTGAIVEHDCKVGNYSQISPNVTLCGRVQVSEYCFIGASSVIIPCKIIGTKSTVAAGSVVIDYVPNNVLVAGVPAKIKKNNYQK